MLPMPAITCWSSSSGFSCRARPRTMAAELGDRQPVGDGVDSHLGQLGHLDGRALGVEHDHLAEGARIDEPQLLGRLAAEVQDDVRVGRSGRTGLADQHAATHPQMDHQRVAGVERADDVLAAAVDRGDGRAGETVDQRLRETCAARFVRVRPRLVRCADRRRTRSSHAAPSRPREARARPTPEWRVAS